MQRSLGPKHHSQRSLGSALLAGLLACQLLLPAHAAAQTAPAAPKAPAPAAPPPAAPPPAAPKTAEPRTAEPKATAPAKPATPPEATKPTEAAKPADPPKAAEAPDATPAEKPAEAPKPAQAEQVTQTTAAEPQPEGVAIPDTSASAAAPADAYPLQVLSPIPGLQLQVYPIELDDVTRGPTRDFDKFSEACTAPCRTSLAPGAYQLTVKTPDGKRATTSTGLLLEGPATVDVDVISHASTRRQGWYWTLVGSGLGAIASGVGLLQDCGPDHDCAKSASFGIWSGITVIAVSWLIGIPKIMTNDEASVTIRPGVSGGPAARSLAPSAVGAHTSKLVGAF